MEHPFRVGDSVQVCIHRKGWLTGTVVALPENRGWWSVRLDGEETVRSARLEHLKTPKMSSTTKKPRAARPLRPRPAERGGAGPVGQN